MPSSPFDDIHPPPGMAGGSLPRRGRPIRTTAERHASGAGGGGRGQQQCATEHYCFREEPSPPPPAPSALRDPLSQLQILPVSALFAGAADRSAGGRKSVREDASVSASNPPPVVSYRAAFQQLFCAVDEQYNAAFHAESELSARHEAVQLSGCEAGGAVEEKDASVGSSSRNTNTPSNSSPVRHLPLLEIADAVLQLFYSDRAARGATPEPNSFQGGELRLLSSASAAAAAITPLIFFAAVVELLPGAERCLLVSRTHLYWCATDGSAVDGAAVSQVQQILCYADGFMAWRIVVDEADEAESDCSDASPSEPRQIDWVFRLRHVGPCPPTVSSRVREAGAATAESQLFLLNIMHRLKTLSTPASDGIHTSLLLPSVGDAVKVVGGSTPAADSAAASIQPALLVHDNASGEEAAVPFIKACQTGEYPLHLPPVQPTLGGAMAPIETLPVSLCLAAEEWHRPLYPPSKETAAEGLARSAAVSPPAEGEMRRHRRPQGPPAASSSSVESILRYLRQHETCRLFMSSPRPPFLSSSSSPQPQPPSSASLLSAARSNGREPNAAAPFLQLALAETSHCSGNDARAAPAAVSSGISAAPETTATNDTSCIPADGSSCLFDRWMAQHSRVHGRRKQSAMGGLEQLADGEYSAIPPMDAAASVEAYEAQISRCPMEERVTLRGQYIQNLLDCPNASSKRSAAEDVEVPHRVNTGGGVMTLLRRQHVAVALMVIQQREIGAMQYLISLPPRPANIASGYSPARDGVRCVSHGEKLAMLLRHRQQAYDEKIVQSSAF